MGIQTTASCECGFATICVIGAGRNARPEEALFPHYCPNCGFVHQAIIPDEAYCANCASFHPVRYGVKTTRKRASLLGFHLPSLDKTQSTWNAQVTAPRGNAIHHYCDLSLTEGDHLCPACKEMKLRFSRDVPTFFD